MEGEEEDIIEPHSALYQYLQDTEFASFLSQKEETSNVVEKNLPKTKEVPPHAKSWLEFLKDFARNQLYPNAAVLHVLKEYRCVYYNQCLASYLVFEDDHRFLSGYLGHSIGEWQPKSYAANTLIQMCSLGAISLSCISVFWLKSHLSFKVQVPFLVLGSSYLTSKIYQKVITWKVQKLCNTYLKKFNEMLSSCSKFYECLKQSIRLVQESEIIGRGFTVGTVKDAITRIEMNANENCEKNFYRCNLLRKKTFLTCDDTFLKMRKMTVDFIQSIPLSDDLDGAFNYLANVPLDQFELYDKIGNQAESKTLTISNIKLIVDRYYLQQSELISRLLLVHFPEFFVESMNVNDIQSVLEKNMADSLLIIKQIMEITTTNQQELLKCLHFHKCLLDGEDLNEKHTNLPTDNDQKKQSQVQTSIHSICLRLQATLARVREFENLLDSIEESRENGVEQASKVTHMLNIVMEELKTCSDCVEQSFSSMNAQTSTSDSDKESVAMHLAAPSQGSNQSVECTVEPWAEYQAVIGDPTIEEQVFEAVADKHQHEYRHLADEELYLHLSQKKQEMEDAVKLYRELKSVLKCRASHAQNVEDETLKQLKQDIEHDTEASPSPKEDQKRAPSPFVLPEPSNLSFSANIAAMAAQKSQLLGLRTLQTEEFIGDEDSD